MTRLNCFLDGGFDFFYISSFFKFPFHTSKRNPFEKLENENEKKMKMKMKMKEMKSAKYTRQK